MKNNEFYQLFSTESKIKIAVVLVMCLSLWYGCIYESDSEKRTKELKTYEVTDNKAYEISKHFVRMNLAADEYADFPLLDFRYWRMGKDSISHVIKGQFDLTKNSYKIKVKYRVKMKHRDFCDALDPSCYELIDIELLPME